MPPVLGEFNFQYTDTGFTFNVDTSIPVFADISKISGLDQAPFRTSNKDTEGQDGGIVEADFETIRTIVVEGSLYGIDETTLDTLKANFAPNTSFQPFYFKTPGVVQRVAFCKSLGFRYDVDDARRLKMANFQFQLQAGDPTLYSSDAVSTTVGVAAPVTTGRGYNRLYPGSYGGAVSSGVFFTTNNGNRPTPVTFTITGPVVNPIVINDTVSASVQVLISLGVSDVLTIDMGARSVLLNGANRRSLMTPTSRWFYLVPGVNQLRYQAAAFTASQVTVAYRHAWR